jgi:hypothetical protein
MAITNHEAFTKKTNISNISAKNTLLNSAITSDNSDTSDNSGTGANSKSEGSLKIMLTNQDLYPVIDARIKLTFTAMPEDMELSNVSDENGIAVFKNIPAPPFSYSQSPSDNQPYYEYDVSVSAKGYGKRLISAVQILPDEEAILEITLETADSDFTEYKSDISYSGNNVSDSNPTVLPAHTLWEQYPPKIAEDIIKTTPSSGQIVLSRVVVPETIVVHDGAPADTTAKDYYVPYRDYIKNVASNEIYATWPEAALTANILAILSFTLNRVYTEWYRGKGYDFTITSSTAFDQKWVYGATIYENISQIVDAMFANYLAKPNVSQPLFTQYCDGKKVSCPGWMTQWGSKSLADDGLSASQIIKYYYGDDVYISSAETISGIPASYPGYNLTVGSTGDKVRQLQNQLKRIAQNYPALGTLSVDGVYGEKTENAVKIFQGIFNLPQTGVTDYSTWYKISQIYVGVTKIAEKF